MFVIVTASGIYRHYKIKKALPLIPGVLPTTTVFARNSRRSYALTELLSMPNKATSVSEYIRLWAQFETIADYNLSQWLPFYYTAYCNINLNFLHEGHVDKNKVFSQTAQTNIKKAEELCPVNYPAVLSKIYNVYSMAYRVLIAAKYYSQKFGNLIILS